MMRKDVLALSIPFAMVACGSQTDAGALTTTALPNDQPLRDSVGRLAVAWNAGDGNAWANEYAPDGSLINILGVVFANAQAVASVTNQILAGPFKGSNFQSTVTRVRFIGPAAAIVDVDVNVTKFRALPPGAVATSPGLLMTRFTFVFANQNGAWKIEASQNTSVLPTATAGQPSS